MLLFLPYAACPDMLLPFPKTSVADCVQTGPKPEENITGPKAPSHQLTNPDIKEILKTDFHLRWFYIETATHI